jgi:hypothetical protein
LISDPDRGAADAGPDEWVTVEETEDPAWGVRVERVLRQHGVTVRVVPPAESASPDDGLFGVEVPLADFDRALVALEDLDESIEP